MTQHKKRHVTVICGSLNVAEEGRKKSAVIQHECEWARLGSTAN